LKPERIHYLDWLKVLIVYGIFVFHVSLVFAFGTWLVSNRERSLALSAFAGFCFPWGIPAMFLIAGADAWFGLRSQSAAEFVKGRIQRLLVPMVAGMIVLSPLQRFVTSQNPPPPLSPLWPFYVASFEHFHVDLLHLWFLGYLFGISLACLPLLLGLRGATGARATSALVAVANRRGGLLLLGAPLYASQLVLRPFFPAYQSWADVATYTVIFMWGAVLFSDRRFEAAIRQEIGPALTMGVVSALGMGLIIAGSASQSSLAYSLLWSLDIWSWLLAVLYLGIRWLNVPNPVMAYAQESVLPFYVVHHPVVLVIASFVVTWSLGVWPKFFVILLVAFSLTIAIYEFGVRRWTITRMAFGLKPLHNPVRHPTAPVVGQVALADRR
jgi:acyltransferase-like protein